MIELFDADCGCLGIARGEKQPVTEEALRGSMERLRIGDALVRYAPFELSQSFDRRNDALFALAEAHPNLHPCPTVVPAMPLNELDEEQQIGALVERGARAVTMTPTHDNWLPEPFVCDRLFAALQARRMPVIAPGKILPVELLASLAGRFPELPLIATSVGYRSLRNSVALLDTFDNVFLSIGDNVSIQGIVPRLVDRYGAGRFVFGTGFPAYDPAGAVTLLMYARINDADKHTIARGTLARLMEEVKA